MNPNRSDRHGAPMPWGRRLARAAARLLLATSVTANMVTAAALGLALAAAVLLSKGCEAAGGFAVLAALIGAHVDGELARLRAQTSGFGHAFHRAACALGALAVFYGAGAGASAGMGEVASTLGLAAGLAVAGMALAAGAGRRIGRDFRPAGAVEPADVFYAAPVLLWAGWAEALVILAGVGAPVAAGFAVWRKLAQRPSRPSLGFGHAWRRP